MSSRDVLRNNGVNLERAEPQRAWLSAHIRARCVSRGVALCWAAPVHDGVAAIGGM